MNFYAIPIVVYFCVGVKATQTYGTTEQYIRPSVALVIIRINPDSPPWLDRGGRPLQHELRSSQMGIRKVVKKGKELNGERATTSEGQVKLGVGSREALGGGGGAVGQVK